MGTQPICGSQSFGWVVGGKMLISLNNKQINLQFSGMWVFFLNFLVDIVPFSIKMKKS